MLAPSAWPGLALPVLALVLLLGLSPGEWGGEERGRRLRRGAELSLKGLRQWGLGSCN